MFGSTFTNPLGADTHRSLSESSDTQRVTV
jgi:hypothetical protein